MENTLRIGKIPYLNSVLFYDGLKRAVAEGAPLTLASLVPRQLSGAAVEDWVDAGPVPLVTCWDLESRYEPLVVDGRGDFCIATREKSWSILLFSKRPFEELGGARVGVTAETSTSVRLMKTLFAHFWRVRPAAYDHVDWPNNDAFLLIGDEALIHRRGIKDYPHVADLGEVWREWTGLPFVFARWVVRRDLDASRKLDLVERIEQSLASGRARMDEITEPRTHDLNMSVQEMRAYLEAFDFQMTDPARDAVERFRQLDEAAQGGGAEATA
jgi:chorismate dehydratase